MGAMAEMVFVDPFVPSGINQSLGTTKSMQIFVGKIPTLKIICYITILFIYMEPREDFKESLTLATQITGRISC